MTEVKTTLESTKVNIHNMNVDDILKLFNELGLSGYIYGEDRKLISDTIKQIENRVLYGFNYMQYLTIGIPFMLAQLPPNDKTAVLFKEQK